MQKVLERRTGREATAKELPDGRYQVDHGSGDVKELAGSTFKRLYSVMGELGEVTQGPENETASDVATTENVEHQDETQQEEQTVEEENNEKQTEPSGESDDEELQALLEGAQEVKGDTATSDETESEDDKELQRSVEDLGLNIKLLNWNMSGTRGGKTDKVTSSLTIKEYRMDITEYAGYITDVRLLKENPNPPENDPDATWELAYKSPKMSLKDTLEWLGLDEDDMKLARKEITAIRKAVKEQFLAQQAEAEEAGEEQEESTEE